MVVFTRGYLTRYNVLTRRQLSHRRFARSYSARTTYVFNTFDEAQMKQLAELISVTVAATVQ